MGYANVDRMLEEISSSMFTEWQAFYLLEPWGSGEEWLRQGQLLAFLANALSSIYGSKKKYGIWDFIPDRERSFREEEISNPDEIKRKMMMWVTATGGKEIRH